MTAVQDLVIKARKAKVVPVPVDDVEFHIRTISAADAMRFSEAQIKMKAEAEKNGGVTLMIELLSLTLCDSDGIALVVDDVGKASLKDLPIGTLLRLFQASAQHNKLDQKSVEGLAGN